MQSNSNVRHSGLNNGHNHGPSCQGTHATRSPGEEPCSHGGDVHIQMSSAVGEPEANAGSRQHSRLGTHGHLPGEARSGHSSGSEEQRDGSLSEFKYLLQWLHRSVPYILILSLKILAQHIIGISLGMGLLTTFMYANKAIVNQVFLRSLHYSLILLSPLVDSLNFWNVLWIVGITDFVLKFLFMSCKCIVLLLPSFIMSLKSKCYCKVVPAPVWFRYFVGLRESDGTIGWSFGILLALLYLILKHIFCDECIALWLNREKTCPLCRTVLSTHVNKWYDGATSAQLQVY
ncbi:hypothetical protein Chor_005852 [Crotalus horridus]